MLNRKSPSSLLPLGLLCCLLPMGARANADMITIVNASFEDFSLSDGTFTTNGGGLTGFGWTASGSGKIGIARLPQLFPLGGIDGLNVAYTHGPSISQVLTATLTSSTTYTLEVGVGDASNTSFGGYSVELFAGGVLLAGDTNSLIPANGGFITSTVTFVALSNDPNLGKSLEIRLTGGAEETTFDNVRLRADITAVPEPTGIVIFGSGACCALVYRLLRKSSMKRAIS